VSLVWLLVSAVTDLVYHQISHLNRIVMPDGEDSDDESGSDQEDDGNDASDLS